MKKIKNISIIVAIIATIVFSIKSCSDKNKLRKELDKLTIQMSKDNTTFDSLKNNLGFTINAQKAIITGYKNSIDKISNEAFGLKQKNTNTIAYYNSVSKVKIDSFPIVYRDTVAIDTINYSNIISVPRTAIIDSTDFKLSTTITKSGLEINKLEIPDTLKFRIVEKNSGLFKKSEIEFQTLHSNKYISTTASQSIYYKPKRKSILNKVLPFILGAIAGVFIVK